MAAIREGRWDCQHCGSRGIYGRDKICPGCGSPRAEGVKFYMSDDAPVITEQKIVEQAKAGADWICPYCGASNQAQAVECQQCYAPKGEARTQKVREYKAGEVPKDGEPTREPVVQALAAAPTASGIPGWLKGGAGLAMAGVVLLCLCISFLFFNTSEATATVAGFSWERSIAIEELQVVEEEDWDVPSGARILSEQEAIRRTEQVKVGERTYVCGQRDLGNGFFEDVECTDPIYEDKAVYDTKYTYEIEKWVEVDKKTTSGRDQNPYWPEVRLARGQQEGERSEQYTVHLRGEGKEYSVNVPQARWRSFAIGEEYTLRVNRLGSVEIIGRAR